MHTGANFLTIAPRLNSRCVRNNDKPADNNVFTGRLPQHHQWQPHQQQLLMHADDVSQNFLIDSQQSA